MHYTRNVVHHAVIVALPLVLISSMSACATSDGVLKASTSTAPTEYPTPGASSSSSSSNDRFPLVAPKPTIAPTPPPLDADGLPSVVSHISTTEKIVFLTIDDGGVEDPRLTQLLTDTGVPVTTFLTHRYVKDRGYYEGISRADGQVIQNHSWTHPQLPTLTEPEQRSEICRTSDTYKQWYGVRPWILRPPYGEHNADTARAAKHCGIDYIVIWNVNIPEGGHGHIRYDEGNRLRPGDIILSHYRPDLVTDFKKAFRQIAKQGFKIAALQDYLPMRGTATSSD